MISMKKQRFSSRPRTKVRRHGPPGSAKAQPLTSHYGHNLLALYILRATNTARPPIANPTDKAPSSDS